LDFSVMMSLSTLGRLSSALGSSLPQQTAAAMLGAGGCRLRGFMSGSAALEQSKVNSGTTPPHTALVASAAACARISAARPFPAVKLRPGFEVGGRREPPMTRALAGFVASARGASAASERVGGWVVAPRRKRYSSVRSF